jgi:hypothetical protein
MLAEDVGGAIFGEFLVQLYVSTGYCPVDICLTAGHNR